MVALPELIPVTIPPVTLATDVLVLLHVPPLAASLSVLFAPTQTVDAPLMLPALGNGLTVIFCVAATVPQTFVTV